MLAEAHIDDLAEVFLRGPLVDFQHEHVVQRVAGLEADILRHGRVKDEAAQRAVDQAGIRLPFPFSLYAHPDGRLQRERTGLVRHHRLVHIGESASGALAVSVLDGQVVAAHNHVLGGTDNRFAVLRLEDVVRGQHQEAGFGLRLHRKRNVNGHLVAVEVGVKGGTGQRVQLDGFALNQHGLKGLNAQTVQRRRAVEQHRMLADHLFEDIPHLGLDALDHALGRFDVVGVAAGDKLLHHEGLEQLDGHLLGQTTLIQFQFRAYDDNRTAGVVHALAQQVLAETTLFAAQQVAQGFERAVARAGHGAAAAAVIDQRVDRFLQHALFVADDNIRRAQLEQPLEAVVAVDDATVEVVEVAGGEAAAVELNHRAQIRRNNRHHVEDHPFGLVAALAERFDDFQALDGAGALLALALAALFLFDQLFNLRAELDGQIVQVDRLQHFLDGLRAHAGAEAAFAIVGDQLAILRVADQIVFLQLLDLAGI